MRNKRTAWNSTCIVAAASVLAASAPAAFAATSPTKAYTYTTRACPGTWSFSAGACYDPGVRSRAQVDAKLLPSGAFMFFASSFSLPPMRSVAAEGFDEDQNRWTGMEVNVEALQGLTLPSATAASSTAARILGSVPTGYTRGLTVSDTKLGMYSTQGELLSNNPIERSVTATFTLPGYGGTKIPVVGPGARQSITFGSGSQIRSLMVPAKPPVERSSSAVTIISATTAKNQCSAYYGNDAAGRTQSTPRLVYYAPSAANAVGPDDLGQLNGGASLAPRTLYPFWQCETGDETASQGTGALLPAIQSAAPNVTARVTRKAPTSPTSGLSSYSLSASITGGKSPYRYYWNIPRANADEASTIAQSTFRQPSITVPASAVIAPTGSQSDRPLTSLANQVVAGRITLTAIDANGVSSSVAVTPSTVNEQTVSATGRGPTSGGALAKKAAGELACCPDWPCVANSSNGFKNTIASNGFSRTFWWTYNDAWEIDFKDALISGADNDGIDNADIGWYTGHGSPNGITFMNTTTNDGTVAPADARWGNQNLEWLQIESCNVLQNTSTSIAAQRWHQAFQGLHVLNGFETTAACNNGLGGSFASLLFDYKVGGVTIVPRRSVVAAWAAAARANEPAGKIYRSIAPIRTDDVTTLGDFVWGQGSVGPDIPNNQIKAYWVVTGTV